MYMDVVGRTLLRTDFWATAKEVSLGGENPPLPVSHSQAQKTDQNLEQLCMTAQGATKKQKCITKGFVLRIRG